LRIFSDRPDLVITVRPKTESTKERTTMKKRVGSIIATIALPLALALLACSFASAGEYKGWEVGSPYNDLYDYKERDSFKGIVKKFKKVTPMPGMDPGTAMIVELGDEDILVHVCPWEYADPKETGIKKGVTTKIKGSWALIDDTDVFIAAKIKQGNSFIFKTRLTKDGKPFWTMTPEELAREQEEIEKEIKGQ
jgi:hypothetical protein